MTQTSPAEICVVRGFVAYSYATRLVDMWLTPFARTYPIEYMFTCAGLWLIRMWHDSIICGWLHSHKPSAGYFSLAGSPCVTNQSHELCQWVMSHPSQRYVLRIIESCLMYFCTKLPYMIRQWVMSRESRSHVSPITKSWLMYEAALYDAPMSHVSRINESCLTNQWVISHESMSHVSRITQVCLANHWVMSHVIARSCSIRYANESCLASHGVMSHQSLNHGSRTKLPYMIRQWVMSRESRSHVSSKIQS